MRALVVAEQLRRPVPGGIGTYVRGLVRGLDGQAAVTLWASRPPRHGPDPVDALGPPVVRSPLPARVLVRLWDRGVG
ncbi:MAG TPA: hypothetical protein VHF91_10885, partial [Acidimicrobiales bacterium]|nr:hypothetical protein [Acidimicrobiales bacterium]